MRDPGRPRNTRKPDRRQSAGWNNKRKLSPETLEPRTMLSASTGADNVWVQPNLKMMAAAASYEVYTPAQIRAAYGFNSVSYNGAGQTIAIVDAYSDPTIAADLHHFDQQFGLSDPTLTIAQQMSGKAAPAYNSGWAMEISLDVEWAHAIAPGAKILLVEANSSSLTSLLAGVDYARQQAGVSVVSMSWGSSEFSSEASFDSYFTTPAGHTPVSFVASSGDGGAGTSWPSISSNVLSVGGTTLNMNSSGGWVSESAWSGSGGGSSSYVSEPGYQKSVESSGRRDDPDVAYDANPNTGFYVYDNSNGQGGWYDVGGTSAGSPQWAALIAIVNQGRAAAGKAALGNPLQAIYSLSSSDFHDITTGSTGNSAKAGYDLATGRGSPIANLVIRDLINTNTTTPNSVTTTSTKATMASSFTYHGGGGVSVAAPSGGFSQAGAGDSHGQAAVDATAPGATSVSIAAQDRSATLQLAAGSMDSAFAPDGDSAGLDWISGAGLAASGSQNQADGDGTAGWLAAGDNGSESASPLRSLDAIEALLDSLT